jgi:hypothetical protein
MSNSATLESLFGLMEEIEQRFPRSSIPTRIDLDPYRYESIKQSNLFCRALGASTLGGLPVFCRRDLLPGFSATWYADGHFEIGCEMTNWIFL